MKSKIIKVGKKGAVIIPARLRRKYGFEEGSRLIVEGRPEGVFLRPAVILPVEIYTPQRKAEFLLNNAISQKDYLWAVQETKKLGVDPGKIPYQTLKGRFQG
jgi:AbrB family looped-hinge helix DNA binding protein